MSDNPFFTVGIPVYNTAKWVGACIESVLSQSFEDFELIILNDGSTDNSLDIISEYRERDSRIKVINRKNMGLSAARNTIITKACGKYVYIFDSDDLMCEKALENAYNAINENNFPDVLQIGLITSSYGKISEKLPNSAKEEKLISGRYTKDERAVVIWTQGFFMSSFPTRFLRTEFLKISGIAHVTKYSSGEEGDIALQILRRADTIAYGEFSATIYFRPREGSITTSPSYKAIHDRIISWNMIFEDMQFWDLSDEIKHLAEKNVGYLYNSRALIVSLFGGSSTAEEAFRTAYMIDGLIGKKIKKLPIRNGTLSEKIIYTLFKIIGIRATCRLMHLYFMIKNKFR